MMRIRSSMGFHWIWLATVVAVAKATELSDEEYYRMPRLFELDEFESCLASRRGAFCLGSFRLLPHGNPGLHDVIQQFSEDKYHFNHTYIHRGYCVSTRCGHVQATGLRARFEACVDNITRSQYGLETSLAHLEYCRGPRPPTRALDHLDLALVCCCVLLLLANAIGTAYHALWNPDTKPNKYLMTWSLQTNWGRLTANYEDGDPRLTALKPVQGMKALTLLLIMLAHSVLAYHITYIQNPLFLEKASHHPLSAYFQNGTSIVQTFIMCSSFLLAYNILLVAERRPVGLRMLPQCLLHRLTRILPVYIFVLGVAASWWARAGDGPLWAPLVGGECARCRDKWWTQLLFVNNLVRPDVKCLIHTWFLAVDMQLYVVSAALTLALARRPRRALPVLTALLATSVLGNFLAAYYFDLRPMVTLMFPEYMRVQFAGERSFTWLYQAPWDSAPAALVGLALAFLLHESRDRATDSRWFRVAYRLSVPGMFLWVFLGYFMKGATSRGVLSLYAAADRPVFVALVATAMYGFFNKVDDLWWRFLSWRGWELLGRMSLSVYLVHWLYALTALAARSHASPASVHEIVRSALPTVLSPDDLCMSSLFQGGHFLWTVFVSYWSALPLHLLVELPMQKFLQAVFS